MNGTMSAILASDGSSPPGPLREAANQRRSCLVYRTSNLGDMIQTLALSRLLPPMTGVYRHALQEAPVGQPFIVNGFLEGDAPPRRGAVPLFAGVSGPYWRHESYLAWMSRSPWPIGARDPVTQQRLRAAGLTTEFIGCATLTLPRYEGPRSGIFSVDCDGPGIPLSHIISRYDPIAVQWTRALELLGKYRTAEAIYTSRLHVALPCLAFGTPVWIARPQTVAFPERFSLIEELRLPWEELALTDVTPLADRYLRFLERQLEVSLEPGAPKCPVLNHPDRLRWFEKVLFIVRDRKWALTARWRGVRAY